MSYYDFERCLYVTDKTAKDYKNSDDLRKNLFKAFQELKYKGAIDFNTVNVLNDAFYLLARLFVDETPDEDIYKNYIHRLPNSDVCFSGEQTEESKFVMIAMYAVLELQKSLPDNIQEFMPYFKVIISQYPFFEKAEEQINNWKEKYGLFDTDIAPNPQYENYLNCYNECSDDTTDTIWNLEWDVIIDSFYSFEIVRYIKLFRTTEEQSLFLKHVVKERKSYLQWFHKNEGEYDTSREDEIARTLLDNIYGGAYLPQYHFTGKASKVQQNEQVKTDGIGELSLSDGLLLSDSAAKDEEIERLEKENKLLRQSTKEHTIIPMGESILELYSLPDEALDILNAQKEIKKLKEQIIKLEETLQEKEEEIKKLQKEAAAANPKRCVTLEHIKECLIELDDFDDAKMCIADLNKMGIMEGTEWPKVVKEIRKFYNEKKKSSIPNLIIKDSNVNVNDIHDNNQANITQNK